MPNGQQPMPSLPVGLRESSFLESWKPLFASGTQNPIWVRGQEEFALYQFGSVFSSWYPLKETF
jgi:hypothetical protein